MNEHPEYPISDELLNAYIDGQLSDDERREILALMEQDKALASKVCDLQRIKQMTIHAFDGVSPPVRAGQQQPPRSSLPRIAAVIAVFCLGILLGSAGLQLEMFASDSDTLAQNDGTTRVLVHLTSADSDSGRNTLENIEQMLQQYRANQESVRVEVVANGQGINLLRADFSPLDNMIARLSNEYGNLSFAACKNTIDQMEIDEGHPIDLLPQAKIIDSGVVEVIKRQQQGWTYIRG